MFTGKTVLVTGGTGTFGKAFTKHVFDNHKIEKLVIFSRDEFKQYQMEKDFPTEKYPIRYFVGDIRDRARLALAFKNVDFVVHAAAMKHVPACEYNPHEAIKTNIIGAQNIVEASINANVGRVVGISTDKAVAPTNLYGATKLAMEKLFLTAHSYAGNAKTKFALVRYGNVWCSRGSVVPKFLELHRQGVTEYPITDRRMTRFNILIEDGIKLVLKAMTGHYAPNSILIPKIQSFRIVDLVSAINAQATIKEVGIRQGEKLHETLISSDEWSHTIYADEIKNYIIRPTIELTGGESKSYSSDNNEDFMTVEDLKKLIEETK